MKKLYNSKKATVTAVGLPLVPALVALLSVILSIVIPETVPQKSDLITGVAEVMTIVLGMIIVGYNIGQGMADFGKERRFTILDQLIGDIKDRPEYEVELEEVD